MGLHAMAQSLLEEWYHSSTQPHIPGPAHFVDSGHIYNTPYSIPILSEDFPITDAIYLDLARRRNRPLGKMWNLDISAATIKYKGSWIIRISPQYSLATKKYAPRG